MNDDDLTIEQLAADLDDDWNDDALADRDSNAEGMIGEQIVVNWRDIDGDERIEAARKLADWVTEWLVPRYELTARQLPDCWWEHGDTVEELSALHAAWQVAFDPADGGYGPVGWHERFALALTRQGFKTRCTDGHRAGKARELPDAPDTF